MFWLEPTTYNSIGLVLLTSAVSFAASWFWYTKKARTDKVHDDEVVAGDTAHRIQDLEKQLAVLTATFTPISEAFKAVLIKQLTHFHTPEMDALLEKAAKNGLSNSEEKRLQQMLIARAQDLNGRIDSSEREAALMLPLVMNRVRAGAAVTDSEVMVVLVPKDKPK